MNRINKRILITGAAGFIGFHTASYLKKRGDEIIGFDNFNSYYQPILKHARANLLREFGVKIIEGDLNNRKRLLEIVEKEKITHILHLAAQAGVRYSLDSPETYVKTNIDGFLNILETCKLHPEIPLIYASSSSVYGLNSKIPFCVEDRTDTQASFYGVTKKSNELMAQAYHHLYGIPVTGLRFFTVYGPWGRPDMAYFLFAKAIIEGRPISLFNDGCMERDFTYIDDIVDGTVAALDKASPNELYNLGNHHPEKLLYLVELLEEFLEKKGEKILLPMQPGDVLTTYASIDKSKEHLGFFPKTSLRTGIANFIKWFKEWHIKLTG